jgi:hypothetical protein
VSGRKRLFLGAGAAGVLVIAALLVVLLRPDGDAPRDAVSAATVATATTPAAAHVVSTVECDDVDIFERIVVPYRVRKLDAATTEDVLASFGARLRDVYRVRAIDRGDEVAAIVIDVALGTNNDSRAGFLHGARKAARRAGVTLESAVFKHHSVLLGRSDGNTMLYGILDCGAVIMQTADVATARALHDMIV